MSDTAELEDELFQYQLQLEEAGSTLEYLTSDDYDADANPDHEYRDHDIETAENEIAEALHHIERITARLSRHH